MINFTRTAIAAVALLAMSGCCGKCDKSGSSCAAPADGTCADTVIETIMTRRSVRAYLPEAVDRESMQRIVECGINAPSGMNSQPWAVRIVDSKEYIDGLTELFVASRPEAAADPSFRNMFRNAPTVVFIASPDDGRGEFDCGLLAENMMLAAWSMGIGSCCLGSPVGFMLSAPEAAPYVEHLNLPDGYRLLCAIGFGYPDETPEAKERDRSKVQFVE